MAYANRKIHLFARTPPLHAEALLKTCFHYIFQNSVQLLTFILDMSVENP